MENKKSISNKKYYEKNYEKIFEHLKQKRLCEVCNRECGLYNLSNHRKSKIHIKNLNNINKVT